MTRLRPWGTRALVVLAVALLVAAAVLTRPAGEDPLDPTSVGRDGLRGVLDLLDAHEVQTDISLEPPSDMSTTAWVPLDRLSSARRDVWLDWVDRGGRLVVSDPVSPLHGLHAVTGGLVDSVGSTTRAPGDGCALLPPAVEDVTHADWNRFEIPDGADACFVVDDHGWLVARSRGAGEVVAVGSSTPFTNGRLDQDDHAVLAAALLAPEPGAALVVVPRAPVGEGDTGLLDLVPGRFWHGLLLLLSAAVVGAVALGRRHGRPVPEALPPVLPARHLVSSLADLWQRAGRPAAAASRLRAGLRIDVARALSVPSDLPDGGLAPLVSSRLGVPRDVAELALEDRPVAGDDDLLAVARAVHDVRHVLRHGAPTGTARTPDRAP